MSRRPPALRDELVNRLRSSTAGGDRAGGAVTPTGAARGGARHLVVAPLRRLVIRLVDPSVQTSLDQLRHDAALLERGGSAPKQAEVEVLRAELAATHRALVELRRRLDEMERALSDRSSPL